MYRVSTSKNWVRQRGPHDDCVSRHFGESTDAEQIERSLPNWKSHQTPHQDKRCSPHSHPHQCRQVSGKKTEGATKDMSDCRQPPVANLSAFSVDTVRSEAMARRLVTSQSATKRRRNDTGTKREKPTFSKPKQKNLTSLRTHNAVSQCSLVLFCSTVTVKE